MVRRPLPRELDQIYGAMATIMRYLPRFEQLRLQGLDKWWYIIGVSRVQWSFELPKVFYFTDDTQILAVTETGSAQRRLNFCGNYSFSNELWTSCQVGQTQLFQVDKRGFCRTLKIVTKRYFNIERRGRVHDGYELSCLANFRDQFVFVINSKQPQRYSLAEDRWDWIPCVHKIEINGGACSLKDKVYVFATLKNSNYVHVLHNPGASISSQELDWQEIQVPWYVLSPCDFQVALVPLNSTEIAILGGDSCQDRYPGVVIFNTSTLSFRLKVAGEAPYFPHLQKEYAMVCENTIIGRTETSFGKSLFKITKADTYDFITFAKVVPLRFD